MSMGFKVVIHDGYGCFGLSEAAYARLKEEGMSETDSWDICRHDPRLVRVVEEMGRKAHPSGKGLVVEEIEGDRYFIDEYDGAEWVVTPQSIARKWIVVR